MMNHQIENILRGIIRECRQYFHQKTMRDSMEDYRTYLLDQTERLRQQNNPDNEKWIQNNLSVLADQDEIFEAALENEADYKKLINRILKRFDQLDETSVSADFIKQFKRYLPNLKINDQYDSISGLFFEYDSQPILQMTCFPKQNFELVLETPKYIKFENGNYAAEIAVEVDFSKVAKPVFSDDWDEMIWAFENELEYFHKLKEMHITFAFLCLHLALKSPEIVSILDQLPIENGALFYANEHDEEVRTIYVKP
ncbi:MAG TPA: hypothetical protein PLO67_09440 [Saprospiraceae bacterium]|mgnify:CR=1 FL=1|nr:hypothetical protein [Saprospiraceae bacterium]HPI06128.1 hypothetical protein [Saprospiraceae bacterium]